MMSEGTKTRDGEALSNALQLLGGTVSTSVGGESGSIGFVSTSAKFPQTLDILADMLLNSTFPQDSLERLRGQRLVALTQARAQPGAIAARVFPRVLYGASHPYGQPVTEDTIKAITRDDIVAFHDAYFRPGRALITVVGDVQAAAVTLDGGEVARRLARRRRQAGVLVSRRRQPRRRRRSTWWTSRVRRSRPSPSASPDRRGTRPTSSPCR